MKRWITFALLLLPCMAQAGGFIDLWLTADQQGQRLLRQERYTEAAEVFETPGLRAAACYRAADFECSAALWGAMGGAEAAYNRGNALVLLGRYDEAIGSYDRALAERPNWSEAVENRELARIRGERLKPVEDDAGGTGGMLGADEIRFDDSGRVQSAGSEVTQEAGPPKSDASMRAVWLRRVERDPGEFLRARFAFQSYSESGEAGDE